MELTTSRKKLNPHGGKPYIESVTFDLDCYPRKDSSDTNEAILYELFEILLCINDDERVLVEFSLSHPLKGMSPIKFIIQKAKLKKPCKKNVLTKRKNFTVA